MEKQLWEHEIIEIAQGYVREGTTYVCLLCGTAFEAGRVYEMEGGLLYDAQGAAKRHVTQAHGTVAELQQQLLKHISAGRADAEIAKHAGIAPSTVRSHRFKLREKEKQATLYLALMHSLAEKTEKGIGATAQGMLDPVHPAATMVDDRYGITAAER